MKKSVIFSFLLASVIAFTSCGSFGEGLLAGMSGMGYGGYNSYRSSGGTSSGGNMDYLLDPNYAAAQTVAQQNYFNQVSNNILNQTVTQFNAKEDKEYQEFTKYNRKADGSAYTKNEWRALKGQAIQNMENDDGGSYSSGSETRKMSSSSSTSSSRTCRKLSVSDDAHCNGSGVCSKCNGKKKYLDTSFGLSHWVDPCVVCDGKGKCPSCNGTGRR